MGTEEGFFLVGTVGCSHSLPRVPPTALDGSPSKMKNWFPQRNRKFYDKKSVSKVKSKFRLI